MKNKILLILLLVSIETFAQRGGGIEHIYYFEEGGSFSMGPVGHFQTASNWYTEIRYNYEEAQTFSFYIGKAFQKEAAFTYSIKPIIGGVVGRFKGGSAGLNTDLEYKNFYFSAQSQYTFSAEDELTNFYFSWSELGYQPLPWLYAGAALQQTYYPQTNENLTDPGAVIGFMYKRFTIPVYAFKTGENEKMFVCSLIWEW